MRVCFSKLSCIKKKKKEEQKGWKVQVAVELQLSVKWIHSNSRFHAAQFTLTVDGG